MTSPLMNNLPLRIRLEHSTLFRLTSERRLPWGRARFSLGDHAISWRQHSSRQCFQPPIQREHHKRRLDMNSNVREITVRASFNINLASLQKNIANF